MNKHSLLANFRVVLSHTSHPGNIGAAARAMKTMGLQYLYLVNPRHFPDEQATAMAAGADDILANAVVCNTLDEALADVSLVAALSARPRDISIEVKTPREAMPVLLQQATVQPIALLFGTEMSGLSNEEVGRAQLLLNIPTSADFSSLNLAAAVQLVAYELRVAAEQYVPQEKVEQLATHEQREGFYVQLEQTLEEIGFFTTQNPKRLMQRLRRLFARARPEAEELNLLRGILTVVTSYNARLRKRYQEEHSDAQ